MADFELKNDLYLEFADFSSEKKYIRFYTYNSAMYRNVNREEKEIIPFSTYYLETLILNFKIEEIDEKTINRIYEQFYSLIAFCEYSFFNCNFENQNLLNSIIVNNSDRLRKLFINSNKDINGVSVSYFGDYSTNFDYSINFDFDDRGFYNNWKKINKKVIKKIISRRNCVAIAMPVDKKTLNSENCYLALSGVYNDYKGSLPNYSGSVSFEVQQAYDAINDLLKNIYGFKFIECHFIDNVMRYTHFKEVGKPSENGRVLPFPITFKSDFLINRTNEDFNAYYSCCERKIVANMGLVNTDYHKLLNGKSVINKLSNYEFRIKKEPCRMCRPALVGCYHIGWYYSDQVLVRYSIQLNKTIKKSLGINPREPLIVD